MRLLLISVVAAFLLLCRLAIAERNGPTTTNIRATTRPNTGVGSRMINMRNENRKNARKLHSGVSRTFGTSLEGKFHQETSITPEKPFVVSEGAYARSQRSVFRVSKGYLGRKSNQPRRSLDLDHDSSHHSDNAIFLEPVYREKSKTDFFSHLFEKLFTHDTDDESGPSIGPLNLPGIGENVYMKLIVPPEKETASHVTVHVVDKQWPVENFHDIYKSEDFQQGEKQQDAPFLSDKKSTNFALIRPKIIITDVSNPLNSRRSRFVDKTIHNVGFHPSVIESSGFSRLQNAHKSFQDGTMNLNHPDLHLGNEPRQYHPSPNHHQLPIVYRPANNLIDLPIYPPLSEDGAIKKEEKSDADKDNADISLHRQTDAIHDTQESASSQHDSSILKSYLTSPRGVGKSVRVFVLPDLKSEWNRREIPEPLFTEEIKSPDLKTGNISSVDKSAPRRELKIIINSQKSDDHGFKNLENKNSSLISYQEKINHSIIPSNFTHDLKHTTVPRTSHTTFPKDSLLPDAGRSDRKRNVHDHQVDESSTLKPGRPVLEKIEN